MLNQEPSLICGEGLIGLIGTEWDQKPDGVYQPSIMTKQWKKQSRFLVVTCDRLFGDVPVSEAVDQTYSRLG